MKKDPRQFGSFCGLDNRRDVYELFARFSRGVPESIAAARRAGFLKALAFRYGDALWKKAVIAPCSAHDAYHTFVAMTGHPQFGIGIEAAAELLEAVVRKFDERLKTVVDLR